jgi:hypothetical protein
MLKTTQITSIAILIVSSYLTGCASVPMASIEDDTLRKQFSLPHNDSSGLYIYRNSNFGSALTKSLYLDDELIGETAPMTYFYREVSPGEHIISTESEFSNNDLAVTIESGKNYFVRHYIKIGVFVGGANLELVSEQDGKQGVHECQLAREIAKSTVSELSAISESSRNGNRPK